MLTTIASAIIQEHAMPTKQLCISADSHVVESAEFFEPLVKRFGDQAPRVVVADPERGPQLALGDGQLGLGISGFFMANVDFTTPEALELRKKGYELARPGVYDISARLQDQDIDGIRSEEHTSELQSQSNLVCRLLLE